MAYKYDALDVPVVNGIYSQDNLKRLEMLRRLLDGESVFFEHQNIELKQDLNELKINVVAPTKFYKSFKELGFEPKVPVDANENNIISFYHDSFSKYNGLQFNKETFLYEKIKFDTFETEALLLSTLVGKTSAYKDFDKPYLSVEFFADTRQDYNHNIINAQFEKSISNEQRNRYLKRFVKDAEQLSRRDAAVVKSGKGKSQSIYISYDDPDPSDLETQKKDEIFEKKIPVFKGVGTDGDYLIPSGNPFFNGSPQIEAYEDVQKGKFCSYDIIGYVITKRKGNSTIKRTYILNDKKDFKGILKYFDSQIKENEEYSYTIEQINKIYGKRFIKSPTKPYVYPDGYDTKQKDFLREDKVPLEKIFSSLLKTNNPVAGNKDERLLPFYNVKDFKVKIPFNVGQRQMVAYSPLSSITDLDSPDVKLNTKILLVKPSIPEISIFSRKGDARNVLVMLSNIIGRKTELSGLEEGQQSKIKIIDLGFEIDEIRILTKDFNLYRTTVKPTSYNSFPQEPYRVLPVENPDFLDDIEPNVVYYYYAKSVSDQGVDSDPSKVLKMEVVQEQDHVFMLLEVYDFGEDKKDTTEKMFKKDLIVAPTLLQSSIKNMIVGGYIQPKLAGGYNNRLFSESDKILRPTQNPSHKIRITSKKTRRRFDINVIYSFEEVKQFEDLPENVELVIENAPKSKQVGGVDLSDQEWKVAKPLSEIVIEATEEEEEFLEEFEKTQTFEKPVVTEEQLAGEAVKFCTPGAQTGEPGGCDPGYKCKDVGLPTGVCEKIKETEGGSSDKKPKRVQLLYDDN
tara:strand:+ start:22 stop:2403 length:2382 start_codon:yes stop_codon:yes gene_type:complete